MSQPDAPAAASPAALARARHATRALFGALGVLAGLWGAHVPSLKARYGLDEMALALALLAAGVGSLAALFVAGRVIARHGTRRTAVVTGLASAAAMAVLLLWPGLAWLLAANVVLGMSLSVHDMAINAEGTALERLGGRPIMSGLHGMFSVGAMAGALAAAAMLKLQWPAALQLAGCGAALAATTLAARTGMLDAHPAAAADGPASFVWPRGTLLVIGALIFAGMIAEGAMYDWCVLYLQQELGLPQDRAALGYAAFAGAMAAARFGGDWLRARVPDARLLRGGAALATVAVATSLVSADPLVALIGFALAGAGLAPVVPLLYTAASRVPGSSSAAAIAAASSIGYSGFLVGPPLIGALAQSVSLGAAMWVVVVAAALLALGARRGIGPG